MSCIGSTFENIGLSWYPRDEVTSGRNRRETEMKKLAKTIQILVASTSVFLVACAGGDDAALGDPIERASEEVSNVVEVLGNADDCYQRSFLTADLLAAVNAARAEAQVCQGVPFAAVSPVISDLRLQNAAVNHSDDMASLNFFSHTGSDGLTSGSRVDAQNYLWTRLGENLAAGQSDVDEVIADWLVSTEGHCELLMDPRMTEMGGSCKTGGVLNLFTSYWTLVLATTE
jgi:uncharacterized protein YkwD